MMTLWIFYPVLQVKDFVSVHNQLKAEKNLSHVLLQAEFFERRCPYEYILYIAQLDLWPT